MDKEQILSVLKDAEEALSSCYQVVDYPANGNSSQDHALSSVRDAIATLENEQQAKES